MAGHYYHSILSKKPNSSSLPSIEEDISSRVKEVEKVAKATFLGLILCLSWNLIAVTSLWIHHRVETKILCMAIAYLLLGVPAAYSTWHREIGLAFRGENGFVFHRFLVLYLLHIVFCLFGSFDPFMEKSLTGFASGMMIYFDYGLDIVGVMYFIGFLLFFYEYAMSVWVLCNVHKLHLQGAFGLLDDDLENINGSII